MARFVETFKDWIVSFPNRYKIIEDGQEKTVEIERDWEPDVEGTSNNERVMNELVKNITYDTDTVHTTESGTSVYICDLVGMKEFTEYSSSDSSFIPKISAQINTTNSNQLSKIRISGKDGSVSDYDLYTINNGVYSLLGANKLKPNTIVIIKIVSNGANKIAVVQYLMDDKLDKGIYTGNASNLKAEIDGKVSKSGDTITGTLNINMEGKDKVVLKSKGTTDGVVGSDTDGVIVENSKSGKSIRLDNDGVGIYPSTSLKTEAKDLSGAVNELLDSKYKIEYKTIGSPTKELDILEFAMTAVEGNYRSQIYNNLITGLPEGVLRAFECRITSIDKGVGYRTIELKPYDSNDVYINTQRNHSAETPYPMWVGWNKLLNDRDRVILDKQDKGVLGGYNGVFPLTVASKNGIYLLPATNKFYVCVENYSGSSLTAPNANFEELSVYTNRNKLENIKGFWALEPTEFKLKTPMTFTKKLIENDIVFVNMGFAPGDSSYTRTKIFTSKATSGFELSGFYAADTSQQFSFALDINTDNILVVRKTGYYTDTMIISVYVLRI